MKITERDFILAGIVPDSLLDRVITHNRKPQSLRTVAKQNNVNAKELARRVVLENTKPTEAIKNMKGSAKRGKVATS